MTWTFTPDFTLVRDQIRQMIGDVSSADPLLSDEAIAFFYAQAGSDLAGGALKSARACAAKLSLEFDKDLDGLSTSRSQRHKAMLDVIVELEKDQAISNMTFTVPTVAAIADKAQYPDLLEPTDVDALEWE